VREWNDICWHSDDAYITAKIMRICGGVKIATCMKHDSIVGLALLAILVKI
jgi:hypothetical protein